MSAGEWRRLGHAARDPAVTFLALLPLGLLHLSGYEVARNAALGVVQELWTRLLGPYSVWVLAGGLVLLLLWAIGRISRLELPWRGGAVLAVGEGVVFGVVLAPVLHWLTSLVPIEPAPMAVFAEGAWESVREMHGKLAISAGAGLYEELVFRAALMGGLLVLTRAFIVSLGWREAASTVAVGFALLASAAVFALAHAAGDDQALHPQVFAFRVLAGILLGGLYAWRGLGVVAYAHFSYDALVLLEPGEAGPANPPQPMSAREDPHQGPCRVFLGVSGASGAIYAVRTLRMLVESGVEVDLVYSGAARRVLFEECGIRFESDPQVLLAPGQLVSGVRVHSNSDIGAPPASGTALGAAALIVPCSLSTLGALAEGRGDNLIQRAGQVALKEARPLLLVPRETPLSRLHLDQMSRLAWAGATLLPAAPGFYHQPQTIEELVDHLCAKILSVIGVPQARVRPWDGGRGPAAAGAGPTESR